MKQYLGIFTLIIATLISGCGDDKSSGNSTTKPSTDQGGGNVNQTSLAHRYFRSVNGNYRFAPLFGASRNDVHTTGIKSATIKNSNGYHSLSVDSAPLSDQIITNLKLTFGDSVYESELRQRMSGLFYVTGQESIISLGTYTLTFEFNNSDDSITKVENTLELNYGIYY